MTANLKSLLSLTAADLMTHSVELLSMEMSLAGAARLLSKAHITGAPVVDHDGCCVGVLSATDFVHWAEGGKPRPESGPCACSAWQILPDAATANDTVAAHMTRDPVTARPGTGVRELARMMLDAHIHRVVVVGADRRPIGIVSSTDILAAIARTGRDGP